VVHPWLPLPLPVQLVLVDLIRLGDLHMRTLLTK
jgi:hypothetical protein